MINDKFMEDLNRLTSMYRNREVPMPDSEMVNLLFDFQEAKNNIIRKAIGMDLITEETKLSKEVIRDNLEKITRKLFVDLRTSIVRKEIIFTYAYTYLTTDSCLNCCVYQDYSLDKLSKEREICDGCPFLDHGGRCGTETNGSLSTWETVVDKLHLVKNELINAEACLLTSKQQEYQNGLIAIYLRMSFLVNIYTNQQKRLCYVK